MTTPTTTPIPDLYHGTACGWLHLTGFKKNRAGFGENEKAHYFTFLTTCERVARMRFAETSRYNCDLRLNKHNTLTTADFTHNGAFYPPAKYVFKLTPACLSLPPT